jgi:hypothetical protein
MLLSRSLSLVQYISDLHLEMGYIRHIIPTKPNLILAGDIGYPHRKNYKHFLLEMSGQFDKVFVISGNHEYDFNKKAEEDIENICSKRNNLFYLQKKSHLLCPENNLYISGCTLWSTLPKSRYNEHLDHVNWLKTLLSQNRDKNYIVATHYCPSLLCLKNFQRIIPNYFASEQSEIIKMDNMVMWIHGHNHYNNDKIIYGKYVVSNQYGKYSRSLSNYIQ